jgi:hypothetical protein
MESPPLSLVDHGDLRREIVAQDGVDLVLDLIESSDLATGQRLRELREVAAADLRAILPRSWDRGARVRYRDVP